MVSSMLSAAQAPATAAWTCSVSAPTQCHKSHLGRQIPCAWKREGVNRQGWAVKTQRGRGSALGAAMEAAERPLWLPGAKAPAYLDGSLAGDFGFDPLSLGSEPESLRWFQQAELIHSRFAMLGAAGVLVQEVLRVLGRDIPVWYNAGAASYFAPTTTLFIVQLILMGFVESKRWMDYVSPKSQGKAYFFGIEAALEGLEPGYPGGPIFNPWGYGTGQVNKNESISEIRTKEIKNGRLAMVAMLGFAVQAAVTGTGPVENLLLHLSDPWSHNIVQSLFQ